MNRKMSKNKIKILMTTYLYHLLIIIFLLLSPKLEAKDYFFHATKGNDANSGLSKNRAFQSLSKIENLDLQPGDKIFLAAGEVFKGSLVLQNIQGTKDNPILIESLPWHKSQSGSIAKINAKGFLNGLHLRNCSHIIIRNLEIRADGPSDNNLTGEMRVGVLIQSKEDGIVENVKLAGLQIHDVFYEFQGVSRDGAEVKTANGTQKYGWGIRLMALSPKSTIKDIVICDSQISNVSHTGIKLTGINYNIQSIKIVNNTVTNTGGPGIQMSGVKDVYVGGNEVDRSGSTHDSRNWGRGSGLWTWSSSHVLIEKNRFTNANGPGDSAGAHIDFNCDNVVLQYNFSANNAGGFCEILGNNYNCAYRYNISVNDGHRIKGENGAFQEGKIFWLSGYQGQEKERKGPVNSYFYNNTIYVKAGQVSKIAIDNRSKGILIVNNIFHLEGPVEMVLGDQYKADESSGYILERVFFENNLFLNGANWPEKSLIHDASPLYGTAQFKNPGGLEPEDYIPANTDLINKGKLVQPLEGDNIGLMQGLQMEKDFLGNPIPEIPGVGAINFVK
jgi:hypothetical protein